jgi:hypothetical protein
VAGARLIDGCTIADGTDRWCRQIAFDQPARP